jgi:hypothetical protein
MRTTPDEHASGRGPDTTADEQELSHDNPRRQREPRDEREDEDGQRSSSTGSGVNPD